MPKNFRSGKRRRRTREHVIAALSVNFLERKILQRGHKLDRPSEVEYGTDATMFHYAEDGSTENGEVRFQLKATDNLKVIEKGRFISVVVDMANLRHWIYEVVHPFILVIYDVANDRGYWLDILEYANETGIDATDENHVAETVTLRVPAKNRLTVFAVDHFRTLSLKRMDDILRKLFP